MDMTDLMFMFTVDGIFTGWADWTDCPVTCGGSDRYRDRECIGPFYGGLPCNDSLFQTKECNPHPCPSKINENNCCSTVQQFCSTEKI